MKTSSANAPIDPHRTWGPTEVYAAAGVHRGVAHSWIARHLVPLPPGPGMGKERQFSFLDAMCVGVVAELTRLGLTVGVARSAVSTMIKDLNKDWMERALQEDGVWTLLIEPSANPGGIDPAGPPPITFFRAETYQHRDRYILELHQDTVSLVRLDFGALARRMATRLAGADMPVKKDRSKNA